MTTPTIKCHSCGGERPDDRERCPHCRERPLTARKKAKMRDQTDASLEIVGKWDPVLRKVVPLDADDWRQILKGGK